MKRLVALAPQVAGFVEYNDRAPAADEVHLRVDFASPKHGTELTDFRGDSPFANQTFDPDWRAFRPRRPGDPGAIEFGTMPLGNMVVGTIDDVGADVIDYRVGDIVCTYGAIQETLTVSGVDNYRLRRLTSADQWRNAVCYDPAQFAWGATQVAAIKPGDAVAIFGLGAIGQLAVQIAQHAGAGVIIGIDPIDKRRRLAEAHGAGQTLDPTQDDVGWTIKQLTDRRGADSVIEFSGTDAALQAALRGLAYGGTISYAAFAHPFRQLDFGREAHFNNARIVFARASSEPNPDYPRWDRRRIEETCWRQLMTGYFDCQDLIDPVVPFAEVAEAYQEYVDRRPDRSIKLGVDYGHGA